MGQKKDANMIRELLRLSLIEKKSTRECGELLKIGKSTVSDYLLRFKKSPLTIEDLDRLSDQDLDLYLSNGNGSNNKSQDALFRFFPYVDKEILRAGVTLFLLWEEYKQEHKNGVNYSRFCHYYRLWKVRKDVSMHQHYKAGEKLFVDFTGERLEIIDSKTGEINKVEVFVAILGCSHYTYVEAVQSQQKQDFIAVNQNALQFLGGVPKAIVPDCLKSAVIKADKYEPDINTSFYDFSRHYNTTILPARALKPKDKSLVENMVRTVYTRVFAPIRNMKFFSLEELNERMWELLDIHNKKQFQQKEDSRYSLFKEIEKQSLQALPHQLYQYREFQKVRVQYNHHAYLKADKHYYSVPWEYTGKMLLMVYSSSCVELYDGSKRIACHKRCLHKYGYSTESSHRPAHHQFKEKFGHEEICNWAAKIGCQTAIYVDKLIESRQHPEQAYKSCMGILTQSKKYGNGSVEKACTLGLQLQSFSSKFINNSLKNGTFRFVDQNDETDTKVINIHANVRGKKSFK